jgi:hypothetical protein
MMTLDSGIRHTRVQPARTGGMKTTPGAPVANTRMIPVLKYRAIDDPRSLASREYAVHWNGDYIGSVWALGPKWKAELPDGGTFPLYSTRRSAGERLRRAAERRSVA